MEIKHNMNYWMPNNWSNQNFQTSFCGGIAINGFALYSILQHHRGTFIMMDQKIQQKENAHCRYPNIIYLYVKLRCIVGSR